MKQVIAPVISNSEVMPGVYLIWLESPRIASLAQPGQFVMVRCGEDTVLPRPLSIHQIAENKLALLFSLIGKGTTWLSQREAGDEVDIFGPLGNSFSNYPGSQNLLLVAGGIGIAPLCFLAKETVEKDYPVTLLYGTANKHRYPEDLLPHGIKLVAATEDGTVGHRGLITDLLPDFIDSADQVFACGPPAMYRDMYLQREDLLKGKPVQVSLEVRMGCGRGVCYGCTIKTREGLKLVCEDGPVFNLDDIFWDELSL